MKRLLIILSVLFLMIDLADDGYVYAVKLVAPQSSSSLVAAHQQAYNKNGKASAGKGNFEAALPQTHPLDILTPSLFQLLAAEVPHPFKIIHSGHLCGSGGLPW